MFTDCLLNCFYLSAILLEYLLTLWIAHNSVWVFWLVAIKHFLSFDTLRTMFVSIYVHWSVCDFPAMTKRCMNSFIFFFIYLLNLDIQWGDVQRNTYKKLIEFQSNVDEWWENSVNKIKNDGKMRLCIAQQIGEQIERCFCWLVRLMPQFNCCEQWWWWSSFGLPH